jgi:hypothetical protein
MLDARLCLRTPFVFAPVKAASACGAQPARKRDGTGQDADLARRSLAHPRPRGRVEAVRALRRLEAATPDTIGALLEDPSAAVSRQVVAALRPVAAGLGVDRLCTQARTDLKAWIQREAATTYSMPHGETAERLDQLTLAAECACARTGSVCCVSTLGSASTRPPDDGRFRAGLAALGAGFSTHAGQRCRRRQHRPRRRAQSPWRVHRLG